MSINVTVSGNPVRINRGKMVTAQDPTKNEFQKRRLMRFEQVRQQSKDIAEEVRNRIKRDKARCQSQAEKEGEIKLKNWQARKLLELQDQYQDVLEDIGLGHRQAIAEEKDEMLELETLEINDEIAAERGRKAIERVQIDKNKENLKKAAPIQRKKLTRDIENIRSATITTEAETNSTKMTTKKKQRLNLGDSDSENKIPLLISSPSSDSLNQKLKKSSKGQQTSNSAFLADKEAQTTPQDAISTENNVGLPLETRISDRIRRRANLNSIRDYCDIIRDKTQCSKEILCNCCKCHLESPPSPPAAQIIEKPIEKVNKATSVQTITPQTFEPKEKQIMNEKLPRKPKITLKSSSGTNLPSEKQSIKYYDHSNRFKGRYVPKAGTIDAVTDDNIIIGSEMGSDNEFRNRINRQDIDAQIRGEAAAEKERIQKEYQDLLKKLPALQKQERLLEIGLDKEKYHMSRDRLEELEKRRQNRLDNAYEELFVRQKPNVVSLPRQQSQDFGPSSTNPGTWDTDFDPHTDKTEELNKMLEDLKEQKKQLISEIESTLSQETLKKSKSTEKNHRKRKIISPTGSDTRTKSNKKARKKVLVLQNCSTQTTPKSEQSAATSPTPLLSQREALCTCEKEPKGQDDMCEIVIKIKDDENPEVIINPISSEKAVTVVSAVEKKDILKEEQMNPEPQRKIKKHVNKRERSSWRDSLTTSSHSTSTSYFEPPKPFDDTSKSGDSKSTERRLDPRLLVYIKKLLNMSRANIDDLAVSGSDVSTPSASIISTPANNPLQQLRNVIKYFNLDSTELRKQLSYLSNDDSTVHNSTASATATSNTLSDVEKSIKLPHTIEESDPVSKSSKKLIQYADIAESCTKKISNLTAMIEKVRAEKKQILLSPPTSGDDLTKTSYMKLPDHNEENVSSTSAAEDELDQKLLGIDYEYAERLKRLNPEDLRVERGKTDEELLNRLKTLLKEAPVNQASDQSPLFLDIPKLPRLEIEKKKKRPPPSKGLRTIPGNNHQVAPHELSTIVEADSQVSTKLESPNKLKTASSSSSSLPDIITETNKNVQSTTTSTDVSEIETMETMLSSIGMEWAIPTLRKTREALALTSSSNSSKDVSLREFLNKISTDNSSDSQGMSLIQIDNRKTSTPIAELRGEKGNQLQFLTDSDISSVKEQSSGAKGVDEESLSKTA